MQYLSLVSNSVFIISLFTFLACSVDANVVNTIKTHVLQHLWNIITPTRLSLKLKCLRIYMAILFLPLRHQKEGEKKAIMKCITYIHRKYNWPIYDYDSQFSHQKYTVLQVYAVSGYLLMATPTYIFLQVFWILGENVPFKQVISLRDLSVSGFSCVLTTHNIFCYHLVRVQFITPFIIQFVGP